MARITHIFVSVFIVLGAGFAFAALGENESTIEVDRGGLQLRTHNIVTTQKYTSHTLSDDQITVVEYADTDGKVFAATWHGSRQPDLNKLLGKFAQEHSSAMRGGLQKGHRRASTIKSENLIVERSGHLRSFIGRAYLPKAIPAGVRIDELK